MLRSENEKRESAEGRTDSVSSDASENGKRRNGPGYE